MAIEEEIWKELTAGKTPNELIEAGYKKPTVYKVYRKFKRGTPRETTSSWKVIKQNFSQERYLPSQQGSVTFTLKNTSNSDLYVYRTGIQPEWMKKEWYALDSRVLLYPSEEKQFSIAFEIPELPLGEYAIRFGIECQHLPSTGGTPSELQLHWSEPTHINIKNPRTGYKTFISHSIKDMYLIRPLENYLDNYGIDPIIAEDHREPGSYLPKKFEQLIGESHFFLGVLTKNSIKSEWVIHETNYALKINKPSILLVEEGAPVRTSIEWTPFRMDEPVESIVEKVLKDINELRQKITRKTPDAQDAGKILSLIGVAVVAFLG
ncbi:MAG: TIR domain-containing protein, partial [Methanophagales archaeon ANME-1-THS]